MTAFRIAIAVITTWLICAISAVTIPAAAKAASQPTTMSSADEWVTMLANDRWQVREDAQNRLIEMGEQARPAVMRALTSSDGEIRARARAVWAGITVSSAPKFTCSGRVIDGNGTPVNGAEIVAYMDWQAFDLIGKRTSDANGWFAFNDVLKSGFPTGFIAARAPGLAVAWLNWEYNNDCELVLTLQKPFSLGGTVVDEKGFPVAGATVRATLMLPCEHGAQYLESLPPCDWFATKTDDRGRFLYDNVPPQTRASFLAWAPGMGRTQSPAVSWAAIDASPVDAGRMDVQIKLPPESAIEGKVIEKGSGKPLHGLAVNVYTSSAPAVTREDGTFRIGNRSAGKCTVRLATPLVETGDWVAPDVEVTLLPGQTATGVTLEAVRGGLVEAAITDANDGRPIEGANFLIFPDTGDWGPLSLAGYKPAYSGRSNKEGLAVVCLPPGQHRLISADKAGEYYAKQLPRMVFNVEEGGRQKCEISLHRFHRVIGKVVDGAGKPVAGAHVMGVRTTGGGRTNAAGAFDFTWRPCNDGPMTLQLLVQHEQRNLCAFETVPDPMDPEINIRLSPGACVTGLVTDPEGKPIPHAEIRGFIPTDRGGNTDVGGRWPLLTDANGRYKCRAIPATEVTLYAQADGYGRARTKATDLAQQDTEARTLMLLPANLSVAGVVVDNDGKPVEGVLVCVQGEEQPSLTQPKTNGKGRYRIDGVCKGEVLLYAHDARTGRSYRREIQTGGPDIEINLDDPTYTSRR